MSDPLDRRALMSRGLRGGAGLLLTGGLGACGSGGDPAREGPATEALQARSIAVDHASFYAPYPDLKRLVLARAAARDAELRFSDDPSGSPAQEASLQRLLGRDGGFKAVVVAPFDAAKLAPLVARAADAVQVVSFVTEVPGSAAVIRVDAGVAGRALVDDLRRATRGRRPSVLQLRPPATSPVPDPFLPFAREAADAVASALDAAGLDVSAVEALGAADAGPAVKGAGDVDAVLAWNDATALAAARALPATAYVGALGAPAIASRATLDALAGPGPLRCLVAPRLSRLADALVDLPLALLGGAPPRDVVVPLVTVRRGSAAARAARADYTA